MNKTLVQVFNSIGIGSILILTFMIFSMATEFHDSYGRNADFEGTFGLILGVIGITSYILSMVFISKKKQ